MGRMINVLLMGIILHMLDLQAKKQPQNYKFYTLLDFFSHVGRELGFQKSIK